MSMLPHKKDGGSKARLHPHLIEYWSSLIGPLECADLWRVVFEVTNISDGLLFTSSGYNDNTKTII